MRDEVIITQTTLKDKPESAVSGVARGITHRIREITLSLSQLRIERELEALRRAEADRICAEQERRLQLQLVELSRETGL